MTAPVTDLGHSFDRFAAIRKTENRYWIDESTISGDRDYCAMKARETDSRIPHWAKDNPIARIALITIHEKPV